MEELIPWGFKFAPTDEELLGYLRCKVEGTLSAAKNIISQADVYACEPWNLNWGRVQQLHDDERYYFVQRVQASKSGNGKRVKRDMEGDSEGGWWKATSGDKKIVDKQNSRLTLGYFKTLKFFNYKDSNRIRNQAQGTDWLMHEYKLTNQTFQEWVICRIKNNTKDKEITANSNLTAYVRQQPVLLPAVADYNKEIILTGTTTDHCHDHDLQEKQQIKFVGDNMEKQHDDILQQILLELDDLDDSSTESDDDDDQDQLRPQFALESRHMNYHGDAVNIVRDHRHDQQQILFELDDVDDSSTESDDDDDDDPDQLQLQFALESRHMSYHGDAVNTVGDHDREHDMSLGDNNVDLEQHDQIFMLHNLTTEQELEQLVQELQLGPRPFLEPHLDWVETPIASIDLEFQFPHPPDDFSDIEAFLRKL